MTTGVACLLALTACASGHDGACRQAEGPLLVVRLVPSGARASPLDVYGGGSSTMTVAVPSRRPVESVRLSPLGPVTTSPADQRVLQLRHAGTTTVTASDAGGTTFGRIVVVHC